MFESNEKKLPDFDKAEREVQKIEQSEEERERRSKFQQFGVCWNCTHFTYRATKYGKEVALCQSYDKEDVILSSADPVIECTSHSNRFEMSLTMMYSMAKLIDAEKPKKAGFVIEEQSAFKDARDVVKKDLEPMKEVILNDICKSDR